MEIARWDEVQLVQRCKDGSESAFAELVRRHRPRLFTLAYRLTGDRDSAEDVVQETFVAAFRAIGRFEPRPSVAAWLNTIALRAAGRAAEKAATRPPASLDAIMDDETAHRLIDGTTTDAGDPHLAAEAAELRREVSRAISALPFKYRAAVVTRYVLGLEYAEAAASLEVGLNTYKSHLLRGTRMLRDALVGPVGREPGVVHRPHIPAMAAATAALGTRPARAPTPRAFADARRARFGEPVAKEKPARG